MFSTTTSLVSGRGSFLLLKNATTTTATLTASTTAALSAAATAGYKTLNYNHSGSGSGSVLRTSTTATTATTAITTALTRRSLSGLGQSNTTTNANKEAQEALLNSHKQVHPQDATSNTKSASTVVPFQSLPYLDDLLILGKRLQQCHQNVKLMERLDESLAKIFLAHKLALREQTQWLQWEPFVKLLNHPANAAILKQWGDGLRPVWMHVFFVYMNHNVVRKVVGEELSAYGKDAVPFLDELCKVSKCFVGVAAEQELNVDQTLPNTLPATPLATRILRHLYP